MSSTISMKSDSNSSREPENTVLEPKSSTTQQIRPKNLPNDALGMAPECIYSGWNIFFGVFLLFTTIYLKPGDVAAVVTQCFAVLYIFAGLISFVLIFKSAQTIFVGLTIFSAFTIVLSSLTIIGFVYTIDGSMPLPELMQRNPLLEYILCVFVVIHLIVNFFSFFAFLIRSCKSADNLNTEYTPKTVRHSNEKVENQSERIIVMDY